MLCTWSFRKVPLYADGHRKFLFFIIQCGGKDIPVFFRRRIMVVTQMRVVMQQMTDSHQYGITSDRGRLFCLVAGLILIVTMRKNSDRVRLLCLVAGRILIVTLMCRQSQVKLTSLNREKCTVKYFYCNYYSKYDPYLRMELYKHLLRCCRTFWDSSEVSK